MQQLDVWDAQYNADGNEGRGPMVTEALFTRRQDAEKAVKGKSTMGTDGTAVHKTITVYASFDEYHTATMANTRKRALAKLSYEEKEALGINE